MAQVTHLPAHPGVRPVPARIYIYGAGENGTQKLPKRDETGDFGNPRCEGSAPAWTNDVVDCGREFFRSISET